MNLIKRKLTIIVTRSITIVDVRNQGSFNPRPSYFDQYLADTAERGIKANWVKIHVVRINDTTLIMLIRMDLKPNLFSIETSPCLKVLTECRLVFAV
jgi:hypothetical protein